MKKTLLLLLALPIAVIGVHSYASPTKTTSFNEFHSLKMDVSPLQSARENYENAKLALKNAAASSRSENARLQQELNEKKETYRLALEAAISVEKMNSAKKTDLQNELNQLTNSNN